MAKLQEPFDRQCQHEGLPPVKFDTKKAKRMSPHEVRKAFPRTHRVCHKCGEHVIQYASLRHYAAWLVEQV